MSTDNPTPAAGECYRDAFHALVFGPLLPENKHVHVPRPECPRLVHGYPRLTAKGPDYGTKFGHAWIEFEVWGVRWVRNLMPAMLVPAAQYYAAGKIHASECRYYTAAEARAMALEAGHYGPWEAIPPDATFAND